MNYSVSIKKHKYYGAQWYKLLDPYLGFTEMTVIKVYSYPIIYKGEK